MAANSRASRYESFFLTAAGRVPSGREGGRGATAGTAPRALCLLRALPGVPLRVVGETLRSAQTIEAKNDGGDAIQHEAIVRDQHQGSAIFQQALFQDFQSRDIQIVGGFVQQQDVRRLEHELRDQYARPFAAGEPADRLIQVLSRQRGTSPPRRRRESLAPDK